jgi:Trk-type K+ transport system membrane component
VGGIAAVWVGAYEAIVLVSLLVLLWSEPQAPADRLVFLAVSAASNVGLSHEPVSLSAIGLYTLTVAMLVGRLAPMGVLWWTAMTTGDAELAVG